MVRVVSIQDQCFVEHVGQVGEPMSVPLIFFQQHVLAFEQVDEEDILMPPTYHFETGACSRLFVGTGQSCLGKDVFLSHVPHRLDTRHGRHCQTWN
ncbi:hypothetical protein ASD52_30240 [Ensifer sp. Root142]|nr:hypothetical protein ASD52_30240 [Ensifer sp. Root142]